MGKKRALIPREQLTTTLILYQTTLPSTVDLSTKMQERAVELMSHIYIHMYLYNCLQKGAKSRLRDSNS